MVKDAMESVYWLQYEYSYIAPTSCTTNGWPFEQLLVECCWEGKVNDNWIVDGQATKNADQYKVVQALVEQLLERKKDVEPVTKDATCSTEDEEAGYNQRRLDKVMRTKYQIVELDKVSLLMDVLWWIQAVPSLIPE